MNAPALWDEYVALQAAIKAERRRHREAIRYERGRRHEAERSAAQLHGLLIRARVERVNVGATS